MNMKGSAGRKISIRHIGSLAIAGTLTASLAGCSVGTVAIPDDKVLTALAVVVAAFVVTQIPSIVRDIVAATLAIARAVGSLALICVVIAAAVTAAVFVR